MNRNTRLAGMNHLYCVGQSDQNIVSVDLMVPSRGIKALRNLPN